MMVMMMAMTVVVVVLLLLLGFPVRMGHRSGVRWILCQSSDPRSGTQVVSFLIYTEKMRCSLDYFDVYYKTCRPYRKSVRLSPKGERR